MILIPRPRLFYQSCNNIVGTQWQLIMLGQDTYWQLSQWSHQSQRQNSFWIHASASFLQKASYTGWLEANFWQVFSAYFAVNSRRSMVKSDIWTFLLHTSIYLGKITAQSQTSFCIHFWREKTMAKTVVCLWDYGFVLEL